jgi:phosphatidate cytidylyltransferase
VADDEGRERRGEDLFEDLDKFFAPIQDVDWPEETAEPASEAGAPGAPAEPAPDTEAEAGGEESDAEVAVDPFASEPGEDGAPGTEEGGFRAAATAREAPGGEEAGGVAASALDEGEGVTPLDDELLADDWAAGIDEGIDLDLDIPPADAQQAPASGRYLGEPTQEMSAEDWAELRGAANAGELPEAGAGEEEREPYSYMERFLPDEEQLEVPEFGYGSEPGAGAPPVGGTTGIDWDQPATGTGPGDLEDSGPITIDDLRRAPEEYRELPGPESEPSGPSIPGYGEPAAAASEDAGAGPPAGGAEPGPVPGFDEEPRPADVEAAAEHFAESIREEEPELGLEPAGAGGASGGEAAAAGEGGDVEEPFGADLFGETDVREPYSDRPEPLVFPEEGEESEDLLSFGEPEGPRTVKVTAAEGSGPSWQESTSVEVPTEAEQEPPRPGRNIPAAILTGALLAVVAAIALLLGKPWFGFVAAAIVLLAQLELYTAIRKAGYQPAVPLGLAVGGLICAGGYLKGEAGILAMTTVGALFTPLWYMATPARHRRAVVANMGMTLFGIIAVPFLAGYALLIIHSFSRAFTIAVLALAFGFDIVAYAVGTWTGNKPLAPSISPHKTREGVYAGFMVLALFGFAVMSSVKPVDGVVEGTAIALVAAAAAVIGDLAESLVKRDLGVKDMGTIFPGHGGALDRIDSILFVAPVVYYFIRVFVF